jgi:hypothetical protein
MGLYDKLTKGGSPFSITGNGSTPSTNPLATKASTMHAENDTAGYSLSGKNFSLVNSQYQQYVDGVPNLLPQPSTLDINGVKPAGPLKDPKTISINDSFSKGEYLNNLPR